MSLKGVTFARLTWKQRVVLWIDHQGFELSFDCSPEEDTTMEKKMEWIERQVTVALERLIRNNQSQAYMERPNE